VLQLWSKGLAVSWQTLYTEGGVYCGTRPRRVSLPTYPFAKTRCLIETRAEVQEAARERACGNAVEGRKREVAYVQERAPQSEERTAPATAPQMGLLRYAEEWEESPLPESRSVARPSTI